MFVKSDEKLFNELYKIACRVTSLAGIIQNDQEVSQEQYIEWAKHGVQTIEDIKLWMQDVYKHTQELK